MVTTTIAKEAIALEERYAAHNYDPLPVVISRGEGAWVTDIEGRRYFDALSAYSALNFGHRHPALVQAAVNQLEQLTLTSRAFHNDRFGPFCEALCALTRQERVLAMNTGAEAVETAIKLARRWGYDRKHVAPDAAEIIVCGGNFHGRTVTIVSFSDDPTARNGFGPFTPGFRLVAYGDAEAIAEAISANTVAVLLEPVQGEAGVVIPPEGFLADVYDVCQQQGVLFIADEVQSGLGRTGFTLACDREAVQPDLVILGKALGGGLIPLSAVAGADDVLGLLAPGEHGSTFGGNPLACAVGSAVIELLVPGDLQLAATVNGAIVRDVLEKSGAQLDDLRQVGLWVGIDIPERIGTARAACERLAHEGVLCKDTHGQTIRFAPPLTAALEDLTWAAEKIGAVLG